MSRLNEEQFQQFATALLTQARATTPDWTQSNDSDPGITLLELFAFLTENLLYRENQIPPRGVALARRLADAALALTGVGAPQGVCLPQRVNYFAGQLLTAEDFLQEQTYFRGRFRRRNRQFHGAGIVSGLQVSVGKDNQGPSVTVHPGFALDSRGEELELCAPYLLPLPARGKSLLVQLLFAERRTAPVPLPAGGATRDEQQFSRVEETATIVLAPEVQADAVSIARLAFSRGHWRVDRGCKPPRARKQHLFSITSA
jgi:hypothetical protein